MEATKNGDFEYLTRFIANNKMAPNMEIMAEGVYLFGIEFLEIIYSVVLSPEEYCYVEAVINKRDVTLPDNDRVLSAISVSAAYANGEYYMKKFINIISSNITLEILMAILGGNTQVFVYCYQYGETRNRLTEEWIARAGSKEIFREYLDSANDVMETVSTLAKYGKTGLISMLLKWMAVDDLLENVRKNSVDDKTLEWADKLDSLLS
jgi:hypothetical protein